MTEQIAIEVKSISKSYKLYEAPVDRLKESLSVTKKKYHKSFNALSDVSFNINKGEIIGIIGKNGSGKSTLLKIITGVLSPTTGACIVNGKISALLELGAGFNPDYTGMQNIYLNGMMLGFEKEEIEKKIPAILDFAEIGDFINQPVKNYSSGMFARLAFSVAINVEPEILIVDEALAVGDLKFQIKCMEKFNDFRDRGKTILFVSHDINSIKRYCSRAIWLNSGKVEMQGKTDFICDRYTDFLKFGTNEKKSGNEENEQVVKVLNEDLVGAIENVTLTKDGVGVNEVEYGSNIKVRIGYLMNVDDIDIVIGVAIHTIDGIYVCGLNTLLDNQYITYRKGMNTITLEYTNINLLGGSYYIDVAIFEKNAHVPIDYRARYIEFFMKAGYIAEGLVALNHTWGEEEEK